MLASPLEDPPRELLEEVLAELHGSQCVACRQRRYDRFDLIFGLSTPFFILVQSLVLVFY